MYKTPSLVSEANKAPNPFDKGKADPSLPRKPDRPEIDISDLTQATAGKIGQTNLIIPGLELPGLKLPELELPEPDKLVVETNVESRLNITSKESVRVEQAPVGTVGYLDITTPTSVTRTLYGGYKRRALLVYDRKKASAYFVFAGRNNTTTEFFVRDPSLISQVDLTEAAPAQGSTVVFDGVEFPGEYILPKTQSYTSYTRIYNGMFNMYETVLGGNECKRIGLTPDSIISMTSEDPPNTSMPNLNDQGNFALGYDEYLYPTLYNFSIYPRLIRIRY